MRNYIFILFILFLTACGGGSSNDGQTSLSQTENEKTEQIEQTEQSGDLISISAATYTARMTIENQVASVAGLVAAPVYDVNSYKVEYKSKTSQGELITASGLLVLPDKPTPSPFLTYQHGTTFKNSDAPTEKITINKRHPEILFASLGYIVFSPDYIGYGSSFGETHPYLQKEPSADIVIDLLQAGLDWLKQNNIVSNGQLFVTGYSQGGYVSMAALQALQQLNNTDLTASAASLGAGPYDLYKTIDTLTNQLNELPNYFNDALIEVLEEFFIPDDAEVEFEKTFLQRYLDKKRHDDVHDWKADIPIKLFHGNDDETVPVEASISTFNTMTALGGDVELVKCSEQPAGHSECALPFLNYTINYFEGLRTDL